ncbi:hypothetical protein F4860DRAFT_509675 [Xylaria cubensis]|nr:hypothetical protein F4860DRAFT_509675 [Xylaria cubensis]
MKIGIGPEPYYMISDTGSSDIWIIQEEFKCLDPYFGDEAPQKFCQFSPLFKWDFSSGKIDNQNLNISLDNLVNYAPLMETISMSKTASPILGFAMSPPNEPDQAVIVLDDSRLDTTPFLNFTVTGAILIMHEEREQRRALFFEGSMVHKHVVLPKWPQLPSVIDAVAGQHYYTFRLGERDIRINPG